MSQNLTLLGAGADRWMRAGPGQQQEIRYVQRQIKLSQQVQVGSEGSDRQAGLDGVGNR